MTQGSYQSPQPFPSQNAFEEDTISLMDIVLVLARHLKMIIITPCIFCTLTIYYVLFVAEPTYISIAKFLSSGSSDNNNSQISGFASQFGFSLPTLGFGQSEWSYEEVINSRTMARNLLKYRFDTEQFGHQKELLQILTYGDVEPAIVSDTLITEGIKAVQGMIAISNAGNMYELEISAFEPRLSAELANAVMEALDKHKRDYNEKENTKIRQFIEARLTSTIIELETAEENLKEFREKNRSILGAPSLQLQEERLRRDVSVFIGVFTSLKQQLEAAKIEEVKESDYVIILDEPEIPLYPSRPQKRLNVILAGLVGIGLGIVLAFIKEFVRNRDEEEREKLSEVKRYFFKNISDFLPQRFTKK
jgi:uncharacterized protein involved in exopolysaccharide biosynthesis